MKTKLLSNIRMDKELIGINTKFIKTSDGLQIKRERERLKLTPTEVARDTGVARLTIENVENNTSDYTSSSVIKLKLYFGLISELEIKKAKNEER